MVGSTSLWPLWINLHEKVTISYHLRLIKVLVADGMITIKITTLSAFHHWKDVAFVVANLWTEKVTMGFDLLVVLNSSLEALTFVWLMLSAPVGLILGCSNELTIYWIFAFPEQFPTNA